MISNSVSSKCAFWCVLLFVCFSFLGLLLTNSHNRPVLLCLCEKCLLLDEQTHTLSLLFALRLRESVKCECVLFAGYFGKT